MNTVLIMGATSGVGLELANQYAQSGFYVLSCGRRKIESKNNIFHIEIDVTNDSFESKLKNILEEFRPEIAIYSSGVGFENMKLRSEIDSQVINTNVIGFTVFCNECIRHFEERGTGHLISITSVASLVSSAEAPSYSATKAYQVRFLQGLRMRCKTNNHISITEIRPGFIKTAMMKGDFLFWVLEPRLASARIIKAISRKRKITYISLRWKLLGNILRFLPETFFS